jgi:hypothetical protein
MCPRRVDLVAVANAILQRSMGAQRLAKFVSS